MSPLTEKAWAKQVIDLAEMLGYKHWRTWNSLHSPKGWPDLALARPCNCTYREVLNHNSSSLTRIHVHGCRIRFLLAELKTDAKASKLTPDQEESIEWLQRSGVEVYVWRPRDFDEIVKVLQ